MPAADNISPEEGIKAAVPDMKYSIVIPAYNESRRILPTLEKVAAYLTQQRWNAEIVVVNDGSKDNTAQIVTDFAQRYPMVRLVHNPGNRGKGYSVRNGMLHATGDVMIMTDADLSSPITEAPKLLEAINRGADVAFGSRWLDSRLQTERQPLYRQFFGRVFNLTLRTLLGGSIRDTQCGFKAFTRQAVDMIFPRMKIDRWGFDPEILFLAVRSGLKVAEVPVAWAHDENTKISYFRDGMRMVGELFKIRWYSLSGQYPPAPRVEQQRAVKVG